jgi:hypothetical protein
MCPLYRRQLNMQSVLVPGRAAGGWVGSLKYHYREAACVLAQTRLSGAL